MVDKQSKYQYNCNNYTLKIDFIMDKKILQKYQYVVVATDMVIFAIDNNELKVLLIKMKKQPYEKAWALPGGLIKPTESLAKAAQRHLKEKTGVNNVYLEQLQTFGDPKRDPFGRVVSVAYFALIPDIQLTLKTTTEYGGVDWFAVNHLPALAYDHKAIIQVAQERLRSRLAYTNIVYSLLPKQFTLSQLQLVYEIILDKRLDKRNFRKKIAALKIIKDTGKKLTGYAHRPAKFYQFIKRSPQIIEIL